MAKEELRDGLEEVIKGSIERLKSLTPGTKEYSEEVDSLIKLYKLNIEETENERAFMAKCDRDANEEREWQLKNVQIAEQKKDRYFKYGTEVGLAVLQLIFYATWMVRGFKYEETGSYTSKTFMNLTNRFRPTTR